MTKLSATALAGTGLIGVAKDNLPTTGAAAAFAAAFVEIQLDVETGRYDIIEYVGVADCGTVIHPAGLETQIKSGAVQGFGIAGLERIIYDPQNGLPASVGFHQAKPPTYGDVAQRYRVAAVDLPDPSSPLGTKGIGEPLLGCAGAAVLCAISEALGGHVFNRTPVVPDMILNHLAGRPPAHGPLLVNCQEETAVRDMMPQFDLYQPDTLDSALELTAQLGADGWIVGGGQDSWDWLKNRIRRTQAVVDLSGVAALKGVREHDGGIAIGALTTLTEVQEDPLVRERFGLLASAAGRVASPQIRNAGTLGGNISQDTRCWYYRDGVNCYRAGGNTC
jgi:hypothetical protein